VGGEEPHPNRSRWGEEGGQDSLKGYQDLKKGAKEELGLSADTPPSSQGGVRERGSTERRKKKKSQPFSFTFSMRGQKHEELSRTSSLEVSREPRTQKRSRGRGLPRKNDPSKDPQSEHLRGHEQRKGSSSHWGEVPRKKRGLNKNTTKLLLSVREKKMRRSRSKHRGREKGIQTVR